MVDNEMENEMLDDFDSVAIADGQDEGFGEKNQALETTSNWDL